MARPDAWTSSSTGHQRSDRRPAAAPRDARARRLNAQLARRGDARLHDAAPAPPSVAELLARPGLMRPPRPAVPAPPRDPAPAPDRAAPPARRPVLDGVVVYVNGSTYPLVSDHRLKHLLREHGASVALHLARRVVTHVVLARPAAADPDAPGPAPGPRATGGGGLAGAKLDREVRRTAGCGVKYVDVEWILQSIKAGIRLPEARFPAVNTAARGQPSVYRLGSPHGPATAGL